MTIWSRQAVWTTLFAVMCCAPAAAQKVTTTEGLSVAGAIGTLTEPVGAATAGATIGLATALDVATIPVGGISGGFATKLDPTTGLKVRKATTFGPSFAETALTAGEGNVGAGVSFRSTTYDKLNNLSLDRFQLSSVSALSPSLARSTLASLVVTSKTLILSGVAGVTDNLDIGVAVPLVTVRVDGMTWLQNGNGDVLVTAKGGAEVAGLGDVTAMAKYRFVSFGSTLPDPGGVAVAAMVHLPTGDQDGLRGLGITRTLVSLVASGGTGRFRPHANGGFEVWSKGIDAITDFSTKETVRLRHQVQYAAGLELEAAPKVTLLVDFIGQHLLGGGAVGFQNGPAPVGSPASVTGSGSLVTTSDSIRKFILVPGLKLNLKGKMLLSLNGLTTLSDNGLHARFTPVVSIDLGI
jgi:hypothetical protein